MLFRSKDKDICTGAIEETIKEVFDEAVVAGIPEDQELLMVNFLRDDIYDEDGVMQEEAPKVYEPGGTLKEIKGRVDMFLDKYNEENPSKKMDLVLFDDALKHMLKINRLMEMPRGSGLLVGVGGSGKQSLTRLSSYISRFMCFQITLTKTYNQASLLEDIRTLYRNAGAGKGTTFLFTESEIKAESFLETLNSVLMTGEVPGLFAKDEIMAMTAELRPSFIKNRPGVEETQDNLKAYLTDVTRDNLHLMLCMSPLNPKFPERARRFPGLVSGPTIDWFLPWPEEALHREFFAAPEGLEYENHPFKLVLASSGREIDVSADQKATEALAEAGVAVDTKCSDGICGVCATRYLKEESDDIEHRDFVLSKEQREERVILCSSRAIAPDGRVVLDL